MTVTLATSDMVVNTPYLDFRLWILITAIGLLLLVYSNYEKEPVISVVWALMAPLFIAPSAYFSLLLRQTVLAVDTASGDVSVTAINVITHPEWLCFIMSVILILAIVNFFYHLTKKPVEKTSRKEVLGDQRI